MRRPAISYFFILHCQMTPSMNDQALNIGGLSKAAGVPTSTVRFYERRGLVRPDGRSRANYRVYTDATLQRVRFIRAAHEAGFTLADIASLLREMNGESDSCPRVQALITARLGKVSEQLRHLTHAHSILKGWHAECQRAARSGRCVVIRQLASASTPPVPRASIAKPKKKQPRA